MSRKKLKQIDVHTQIYLHTEISTQTNVDKEIITNKSYKVFYFSRICIEGTKEEGPVKLK